MKRRDFVLLLGASLFPIRSAMTYQGKKTAFFETDWKSSRLSLKAYRSVQKTGRWRIEDIEGEIPNEISGMLLRVGPGQKENHKTQLKHFFDGDALIQALTFKNGNAEIYCDFIDTPERREEIKKGQMLYNEFGTTAPKKTRTLKNQPNISIIPWRGHYLALSEGGHPVLLDGNDFSYISDHNFKGTLAKNISFTAHPKFDPLTGKGYAFGIKQGAKMSLHVFEMDPVTDKLTELYSMPQSKVYMIHDFMVGSETIAFMVPAAFFKLTDIILNKGSMADALTYDSNHGNRLIILEKKKNGRRVEVPLPASMSFHCGNLYEDGEELVFDICQAKSGSLLKHIARWHEAPAKDLAKPDIIQWRVDRKTGRVIHKKKLGKGHDFPFFNKRYLGKKSQFLYAAELGQDNDPMRFRGISKFDHDLGRIEHYKAQEGETFGEPVFHWKENSNGEDDGWLFIPGYHEGRDQSFVKIIDAKSFAFEACMWFGTQIPVGFHGHFIKG